MDVFTAKALNSTLGTEKFQAFDQLIGTKFEKINEAIQNNLAKEIKSILPRQDAFCVIFSFYPTNIYLA